MREIFVSPFCTAFAINDINLQYVLPRLTQDLPSFECCFAQEIIMVPGRVFTVRASSWAFQSGLWTETRAFQVQAFQAFWAFPVMDF